MTYQPEPKSVALAIVVAIILGTVALLTSCEPLPSPPVKQTDFQAPVELVTWENVAKFCDDAYWQGAKEQAISNDAGKPILIAERRDGKLIIYKPVESFPVTPSVLMAEAEALIEATETPLPKKK